MTHSKPKSHKSTQHVTQPFFRNDSANQKPGSFFTQTPPAIQKKCASCEDDGQIQTKLTIGQPDDQYEREADAVADRIVGQSEANIQRQEVPEEEEDVQAKSLSGQSELPIQRQTEQEEEEEEIQAKTLSGESSLSIQRQAEEENEEEEMIQAKSTSQAAVSPNIATAIKSTQGSGQALTGSTRHFFESSFGRDFGDVKIHADSRANHLARSINARAFTHGRDIYFNSGQYQPSLHEGRHLLSHELTHVIQQRGVEGHLQRLVTCETSEDCPTRLAGESGRSRTTPMDVQIHDRARFGILISNFAVNEHQLKPGFSSDRTWQELARNIGHIPQSEWEILGFTDCPGSEARNNDLRRHRAEQVVDALGPLGAVFSRVIPASLTECIDSNASETGRQRNRSVLVHRVAAPLGPTPAGSPAIPIGPVRPPGSPGNFCRPYTSAIDAAIARAWLIGVWIPGVSARFANPTLGALWLNYLSRPKGASLTPIIYRPPNPIAMTFAHDPLTLAHRRTLYTDIRRAAIQTPEANVPFSGSSYTSPLIPLTSLLPVVALVRVMNYPDPVNRIPGNIAGGTGASDAGPDQRVISGAVRIHRQKLRGGRERRTVLVNMQLQVIDAVDFCPGAAGGTAAQAFTIPMSRLEATPTEPTYDLPFHVFVDLSGSTRLP